MLLLAWLVAVINDKSRFVNVHMARSCRVVQICGTIGSISVLTVSFTLSLHVTGEGLLDLLLVLLT